MNSVSFILQKTFCLTQMCRLGKAASTWRCRAVNWLRRWSLGGFTQLFLTRVVRHTFLPSYGGIRQLKECCVYSTHSRNKSKKLSSTYRKPGQQNFHLAHDCIQSLFFIYITLLKCLSYILWTHLRLQGMLWFISPTRPLLNYMPIKLAAKSVDTEMER